MNKMKFHYCLFIIFTWGCTADRSTRNERSTEHTEAVNLSISPINLTPPEVENLISKANTGDGKAAFSLYSYYALQVFDEYRSKAFFKRALELEYPEALYIEAFDQWTKLPQPDLSEVERLAKKAIELGANDPNGLLDEIVDARKKGEIPKRSKLRLFF